MTATPMVNVLAVVVVAAPGTEVQSGSLLLAVPIALVAGLLSFLSPCVLPLVPGYLSYVTGMSAVELRADQSRGDELNAGSAVTTKARNTTRVLAGSVLFVLGLAVSGHFPSSSPGCPFTGPWPGSTIL